ncbi:unnamed protein product [Prorocentrum cordatum]|uniref:Uncharacterized protein n=1 Tax=Prorocentrum cordatum TaxID=2364126 RepID=A0ABN9S1G7_9DINO|nr:unnamed protein product [Polarella glacialis]
MVSNIVTVLEEDKTFSVPLGAQQTASCNAHSLQGFVHSASLAKRFDGAVELCTRRNKLIRILQHLQGRLLRELDLPVAQTMPGSMKISRNIRKSDIAPQ